MCFLAALSTAMDGYRVVWVDTCNGFSARPMDALFSARPEASQPNVRIVPCHAIPPPTPPPSPPGGRMGNHISESILPFEQLSPFERGCQLGGGGGMGDAGTRERSTSHTWHTLADAHCPGIPGIPSSTALDLHYSVLTPTCVAKHEQCEREECGAMSGC